MRSCVALVLACTSLIFAGCDRDPAREPAPETGADSSARTVTFNRDVAPIVFRSCSPCHRPGEATPFSLLTFGDFKKKGRQIVEVTESGFMPPWMPELGFGDFEAERRLAPGEVETIRRWVEAGAPEGDPADLPPAPTFPAGWQLGEPDLVITMPEPFEVPASGPDVFRNFVVPVPIRGTRFVEALEFRPGNKRVVHHAIMQIDRSASARTLDAADEIPGFPGMSMAESVPPDGHFLGWTPGKSGSRSPDGMSWRLEQGADLVVQLHILPSGKPETVQCSIGLHFAEQPPTRHPYVILLRNDNIDIPAGQKGYTVEDSFVLPTDVSALAVYPHAHYLGKELQLFAELPGGEKRWLLKIGDWDFNWQDEYRYQDPPDLPKGTRLTMRYSYDNSADNPRNPHRPPRRARFGESSFDEMATLSLQVELVDSANTLAMEEGFARHEMQRNPRSWKAYNNLGTALSKQQRFREAIAVFQQGLEVENSPHLHMNLGSAFGAAGQLDEAIRHLRLALAASPDDTRVQFNLATAHVSAKQPAEAITHLRSVLRSDPRHFGALLALTRLLERAGESAEAIDCCRRALDVRPGNVELRLRLAQLLLRTDQAADAIAQCELLLRAQPNLGVANGIMGLALIASGKRDEGLRCLRQGISGSRGRQRQSLLAKLAMSLASDPASTAAEVDEAVRAATAAAALSRTPQVLDSLAAAQAAGGRYDEAAATAREAIGLAEAAGNSALAAEVRERLELYEASRPYRR